MVTKKDALIVGVVLVGGLGLASMMADSGSGGAKGFQPQQRFGGILGTYPGGDSFTPAPIPGAPTVYNIPADTFKGFPETTQHTVKGLLPGVSGGLIETVSETSKNLIDSVTGGDKPPTSISSRGEELSKKKPTYIGGIGGTYKGKSPFQLQEEMKKVQALPGKVTTKEHKGTLFYYKELEKTADYGSEQYWTAKQRGEQAQIEEEFITSGDAARAKKASVTPSSRGRQELSGGRAELSKKKPTYIGGIGGTYKGKSPFQLQEEMKKVQALPGKVTTKEHKGTQFHYKEL